MKYTGILMSGPMVRAIQDGTKTQTRRVIKPQPKPCNHPRCLSADRAQEPTVFVANEHGEFYCQSCGNGIHADRRRSTNPHDAFGITCPYGQVGDRLWVRETWQVLSSAADGEFIEDWGIGYKDGQKMSVTPPDEWLHKSRVNCFDRWRPSIHMPRWASRITLEITAIKVERLDAMAESDATAEGVDSLVTFMLLWDRLNGKRGYKWETRPWVWVIRFQQVLS